MTETVPGGPPRPGRGRSAPRGRRPTARTIPSGDVLAEDARDDPAVLGGDGHRLVAPDEAGARVGDRFEEVALGADLADLGQVRPELAADVADRVAGDARRLRPVEHRLPAPDVPPAQARRATLRAAPTVGRVGLDARDQRLGLRRTAGPNRADAAGASRRGGRAGPATAGRRPASRPTSSPVPRRTPRAAGRLRAGPARGRPRPASSRCSAVELRPGQDVGGGRPVGGGAVGLELVSRKAKAAGLDRGQPPGDRRQGPEPDLGGQSRDRPRPGAGPGPVRRDASGRIGTARAVATAWRTVSARPTEGPRQPPAQSPGTSLSPDRAIARSSRAGLDGAGRRQPPADQSPDGLEPGHRGRPSASSAEAGRRGRAGRGGSRPAPRPIRDAGRRSTRPPRARSGDGRGERGDDRLGRRAHRRPSGRGPSAAAPDRRGRAVQAGARSPAGRRSRSGRRSPMAEGRVGGRPPAAEQRGGRPSGSPIRPSASAAAARPPGRALRICDQAAAAARGRARAPPRGPPPGGRTHRVVRAPAGDRPGRGRVDPAGGPDGVAPGLGRGVARERTVASAGHGRLAPPGQLGDRPAADGGAGVVEQPGQVVGRQCRPSRASGRAGRRPWAASRRRTR